jgi:hypothetical protein
MVLHTTLHDIERVLYFEAWCVIEAGMTPLKHGQIMSDDNPHHLPRAPASVAWAKKKKAAMRLTLIAALYTGLIQAGVLHWLLNARCFTWPAWPGQSSRPRH